MSLYLPRCVSHPGSPRVSLVYVMVRTRDLSSSSNPFPPLPPFKTLFLFLPRSMFPEYLCPYPPLLCGESTLLGGAEVCTHTHAGQGDIGTQGLCLQCICACIIYNMDVVCEERANSIAQRALCNSWNGSHIGASAIIFGETFARLLIWSEKQEKNHTFQKCDASLSLPYFNMHHPYVCIRQWVFWYEPSTHPWVLYKTAYSLL